MILVGVSLDISTNSYCKLQYALHYYLPPLSALRYPPLP